MFLAISKSFDFIEATKFPYAEIRDLYYYTTLALQFVNDSTCWRLQ